MMYKILAAFIIFAILIFLAFTGSDAFAQKGTIERKSVSEKPSSCYDSASWACVPCSPAGNTTGSGCWCKFCIGGAQRKTVEKDNDLRGIYCMDNRTRLDLLIKRHKAYAGIW